MLCEGRKRCVKEGRDVVRRKGMILCEREGTKSQETCGHLSDQRAPFLSTSPVIHDLLGVSGLLGDRLANLALVLMTLLCWCVSGSVAACAKLLIHKVCIGA